MKIKEVHFKLHTRIALLVCGVVALVLIVTNIFISKK